MVAKKNISIVVLLILMFSSLVLSGCTNRGPRDRFGGEGFPQMNAEERQTMMEERQKEAVEACADKSENDECSVVFLEREMSGTCVLSDDVLSCLPEGKPQREFDPNRAWER